MAWIPPFQLFNAGRQIVASRSYDCDVSAGNADNHPQRILIKHTLSGEGVLYASGRRLRLSAGEIFVIERPGPYRYCYEGEGAPWRFEYVSIRYSNSAGLLPPQLREQPVCDLKDQDDLREQLAELVDLRSKDQYQSDLRHSALAYRFFLSYISFRIGKKEARTGAALRLRDQLEDPARQNDSIGQLASEMGYSQEALTRLFTSAFGIPPGRFARNVRIRRACRLLEEHALRISEVAVACGFRDANYFTRTFRQCLGVTPGAFRANPDPLLAEKLLPPLPVE